MADDYRPDALRQAAAMLALAEACAVRPEVSLAWSKLANEQLTLEHLRWVASCYREDDERQATAEAICEVQAGRVHTARLAWGQAMYRASRRTT